MANTLYDFVPSEATSSTTGGVNTADGQAPSTVNDAMRVQKQLIAKWLDDLAGVNTVGGTATAITVTTAQGFTAYGTGAGQIANGTVLVIKAGSASSGATTLAVDGLSSKKARRQGDSAIAAGDWVANGYLLLRYDTAYDGATGAWALLNRDMVEFAAGIAAFLATPSSANLAAAVTDETGSGPLVFGTAPTITSASLVTPALGTPASGTLTNTSGFPIGNLFGAGTGVLDFLISPSSSTLQAAVGTLADSILSAGMQALLAPTAGMLGSYVFAKRISNVDMAYGDTVSGANLVATNSDDVAIVGPTLSGTYRLMGEIGGGAGDINTSVFARVA